MKGQPDRDSNPVPPSQWSKHATNHANEAGGDRLRLPHEKVRSTGSVKIADCCFRKKVKIKVTYRNDVTCKKKKKI